MKKIYNAPQISIVEVENDKFLVVDSLQLYSGPGYKVGNEDQLSRKSYNDWDNIWK